MARLRLEAILIASGVFVLLLHSSNVFPSESNERNVFARFLRKPTPAKVTKEELGRGSWTLIHTMAANYPEKPTPTERVHAAAFFQSIGTLYPCKLCRDHFARYISVQSPEYVGVFYVIRSCAA